MQPQTKRPAVAACKAIIETCSLFATGVMARFASSARRAEGGLQVVHAARSNSSVELEYFVLYFGGAGAELVGLKPKLGLGHSVAFVRFFSEGGVAQLGQTGHEVGVFSGHFASDGMRPLAMAPSRPKCEAITVNAAFWCSMASSGFWNCADAGRFATAQAIPIVSAARRVCFKGGLTVGG